MNDVLKMEAIVKLKSKLKRTSTIRFTTYNSFDLAVTCPFHAFNLSYICNTVYYPAHMAAADRRVNFSQPEIDCKPLLPSGSTNIII